MTVQPDVSIVVAAYNVENYLRRALESALAQRGVAVEAIAVDDASTDGTWEILSSIRDPRLRRIRQSVNTGPGAARNAGFAEAKGRWIAVLDGDDEMEPDRLARCLARAEAERADLVVDNLTVRREADGARFPMFPPAAFAGLTLNLAAFIRGAVPGAGDYTLGYLKPVFSAAFLARHRLAYNTALRIGEDYLLMAEALALGARCAVEPEAGYLYTARAGSISHRLSLADVERMQAADAAFLARHRLDEAAALAQAERSRTLATERAFAMLVAALKRRDARAAFKAAAGNPAAVLLLRKAIGVRLRRLFGGRA